MSENEQSIIHVRYVGGIFATAHEPEDIRVQVHHIFGAETEKRACGHEHADPGVIGLTVAPDDVADDDPAVHRLMLSAESALILANRLQRAASLVLEGDEELPDAGREALRLRLDDARWPE